ncbi:MAG: ATP-binding cassette domain-containing protein, partial [Chloroflexota bacterium]
MKIEIENLSLQYADGAESLRGISMGIRQNAVTVLFGPAGGGKSTLLRCLNRLNDLTDIRTSSGRILIDGENILDPKTDVIALRRKVGMVFARPVPLPMSIRENITYGLGPVREDVLRQALADAHCLDFVQRLPQGLETSVGSAGSQL